MFGYFYVLLFWVWLSPSRMDYYDFSLNNIFNRIKKHTRMDLSRALCMPLKKQNKKYRLNKFQTYFWGCQTEHSFNYNSNPLLESGVFARA